MGKIMTYEEEEMKNHEEFMFKMAKMNPSDLMAEADKQSIQYKFNEDEYIDEIKKYVASTYGQHYSKKKFQAAEFIYDAGHGAGFNMGNVMKYAQRYGNKGTAEDARKDLMKVIHYAILQLHVHDKCD
jgi:uncharacterized protein with PIN domain